MKSILKLGSIALALPLMLTPLCQAQQWSGEQSLGGDLYGTPAIAQIPGTNVLQAFYEGGDFALWTRWRNSDGSWSGEQRLGGQLYPGTAGDFQIPGNEGFDVTPTAIQIPNTDYLIVFYRGPDSTLRYQLRDNNGNWGGEGNMGGQMSGNPAVAQVPGTNQIEVFYQGAGGRLKTQWGNLNSWVYETDMGGQLFAPTCTDITNESCYGPSATPAVVQLGDTDLWVFYRGPDNTLRARLRDQYGNWNPEQNFGGDMVSDPTAAQVPNTQQIVVYYAAQPVNYGPGQLGKVATLAAQWGNLNYWNYETDLSGADESYMIYCDAEDEGCSASYSAPKAYVVGNNLWVFYRYAQYNGPGTTAPGVTAWNMSSPTQGNGWNLGGSFPITDPIAALIPGTDTVQIFYVEDTDGDNGYLASMWYPN